MFKYVRIPAEESEPIVTLEASKAGGLENDELAKNAKEYFFEHSGQAKSKSFIENASAAERKQIADKIRNQYASAPQINAMDDDALIQLVQATQSSATCEITCLTVPTPVNGQKAVSMYGDDNARNKNLQFNKRATALMKACGHALPADNLNEDGKQSGVHGDVFVGRCHDSEMEDIWEREDMTAQDVEGDLDKVEWCRTARKKGGGGGHGGAAASLSKTMSNYQQQQQQQYAAASGATLPASTAKEDKEESGYKWTQNKEEVEIRFAVSPAVKARKVKVKFASKSLKVVVAGETLCDGETWGAVIVDESTFTFQDDSSSGRELCVSLCKRDEEEWNFAVMSKK